MADIKLPAMEFEAEFHFRQPPCTLFEDFFGSAPPPLALVVRRKARNKVMKISVAERPRRSTRELMREGGM